jgi:hypothetical protein
VCLASGAHAEPARLVVHDGLTLALSHTGDGIEISYIDVPAVLRELGVQSGQVVVRGKWDDTILVGEAFVFARGCAPIAYPIRGVVDRSGALILIGPQPQDCEAKVYVWGEGAVMRFEPPRAPPVREKPKVRPKPKPKPKPKPRQEAPAAPRPQYQQPQPWQWRW